MKTTTKRMAGGLYGLAIGDALGAAVEFLSLGKIYAEYGRDGIQEPAAWSFHPAGSYTDDTQMSLATLEACLDAALAGGSDDIREFLRVRYREWLESQHRPGESRAPGGTCISALATGQTVKESKGCGGVMRTAPIGWYFDDPEEAYRWGIYAAYITHGHPTGYLTAGYVSALTCFLMKGETLRDAVAKALDVLVSDTTVNSGETIQAIRQAVGMSETKIDVIDAIRLLGQGWVAEEALAIALFCALRFDDNKQPAGEKDAFSNALRAAANHDGDSDSTACIAGAILGTLYGLDAIPDRWIATIENGEGLEDAIRRLTIFTYHPHNNAEAKEQLPE